MAYIVVKYAKQQPDGWTRASAYDGYSCKLSGVSPGKVYAQKNAEALSDLKRLQEVNESVDFGFVEVE